jgi:hypothetical protein
MQLLLCGFGLMALKNTVLWLGITMAVALQLLLGHDSVQQCSNSFETVPDSNLIELGGSAKQLQRCCFQQHAMLQRLQTIQHMYMRYRMSAVCDMSDFLL